MLGSVGLAFAQEDGVVDLQRMSAKRLDTCVVTLKQVRGGNLNDGELRVPTWLIAELMLKASC